MISIQNAKQPLKASLFSSLYPFEIHCDSHAYKNTGVTKECISLIFELTEVFLSFQTVISLAIAVIVSAILDSISGFDLLSITMAFTYSLQHLP